MELGLLDKINEMYDSMSKGQKKIADFIMKHSEKAVFMTAAKIGESVDVSESTVVRFATLLGFEGYPEFHRELELVVEHRLKRVEKIDVANDKITADILPNLIMQSDLEKLQMTVEEFHIDSFLQAVKMIEAASHIYIIGIRTCMPLASYLGMQLKLLFKNVTVITTNNASEVFEQMLDIEPTDVCIGISFPRYSLRTLKALEFANSRKANVITITDTLHSPVNIYSSCHLLAKTEMSSVLDSLTAPMCIINCLIMALYMNQPDVIANRLNQLDEIWDEYQVYSNDELNRIRGELEIERT